MSENTDSLGRIKGYKRLFDVGMEVEQPSSLMGSSQPYWLNAVGGTQWHRDQSGPMEFSFKPATSSLTEIFKPFAEEVRDEDKWEWTNNMSGHRSYIGGDGGCGSHIHFGTKQSIMKDNQAENIEQVTVFYNTAVTFLPFAVKYFSCGRGNTLRRSAMRWGGLENLQRYSPNTVSNKFQRRGRWRDNYSFLVWNKQHKDKITLELRVNEQMPQWSLPMIDMFLLIANKHIAHGQSPKLRNHRAIMRALHQDINNNNKIHDTLDMQLEFEEGRELFAPNSHVIGDKFPTTLTVRQFLKLIDRLAYWTFAYSSRKLHTQQMRYIACGGDTSKLPTLPLWKPWDYDYKKMFDLSNIPLPNINGSHRKWIKEHFPKVTKRTHTPFAHANLGEQVSVSSSNSTDTSTPTLVDLMQSVGMTPRSEVRTSDLVTSQEVVTAEFRDRGEAVNLVLQTQFQFGLSMGVYSEQSMEQNACPTDNEHEVFRNRMSAQLGRVVSEEEYHSSLAHDILVANGVSCRTLSMTYYGELNGMSGAHSREYISNRGYNCERINFSMNVNSTTHQPNTTPISITPFCTHGNTLDNYSMQLETQERNFRYDGWPTVLERREERWDTVFRTENTDLIERELSSLRVGDTNFPNNNCIVCLMIVHITRRHSNHENMHRGAMNNDDIRATLLGCIQCIEWEQERLEAEITHMLRGCAYGYMGNGQRCMIAYEEATEENNDDWADLDIRIGDDN